MKQDTPLRRWRISRGLTQVQAGEKCGMAHKVFARYETAERLPYPMLLAGLQKCTGLSFDALLHPVEYLAKHPDFLAAGAKPIQQGPGFPKGEKRRKTP